MEIVLAPEEVDVLCEALQVLQSAVPHGEEDYKLRMLRRLLQRLSVLRPSP